MAHTLDKILGRAGRAADRISRSIERRVAHGLERAAANLEKLADLYEGRESDTNSEEPGRKKSVESSPQREKNTTRRVKPNEHREERVVDPLGVLPLLEQGQFGLAYDVLKREASGSRDHQVLAQLAYTMGDNITASTHFAQGGVLVAESRFAYAAAQYGIGERDYMRIRETLDPTLESAPIVHKTLGVVMFNNADYLRADLYFRAAGLDDGSFEQVQVVKGLSGEDVEAMNFPAIKMDRILYKVAKRVYAC